MPRIFVILLGLAWATALQAGTELVMFQKDGCIWCARWDREIAPIYPKTAEGRTAPLHRLDIHDALPEGVTLAQAPVFTPTFVLLVDGQERGRIEGYPGNDFFWFLLAELLKTAGVAQEPSG